MSNKEVEASIWLPKYFLFCILGIYGYLTLSIRFKLHYGLVKEGSHEKKWSFELIDNTFALSAMPLWLYELRG